MRYIFLIVFTALILPSCFITNPYRKQEFSFNEEGTNYSIPFIVPRGFKKKWSSIDEKGNTIQTYSYKDGSVFYFSHMKDSSVDMQPIMYEENHPHKSHHTNAIIYKGIDKNMLYYREVRQGKYWMGYRFVDSDDEYKFDSATNVLVAWPVQLMKK